MHPSHPKSVQMDLFRPPDHGRLPKGPPWPSLPDGTRRRATVLMARMLLEHRGEDAAETAAASGRDGETGDV